MENSFSSQKSKGLGQDWQGPDGPLGKYISEQVSRRLESYSVDPDLVNEHANQEEDAARGGYARRQVFELVQNGADALSESAGGRIWIGLTQKYLYCADEGEPIDRDGVKALMYSHLSPKRATGEIGRFGLGFKSVLGVTDTPEFFSRSGSFRFDRQSAKELVQKIVPLAERYPVLRLPEPFNPYSETENDPLLLGLMRWASNIVRLPLMIGAHENLARQLADFPAEFLLFVEHVSELTLQNDPQDKVSSFRLSREGGLFFLSDGQGTTRWMIEKAIHKLSSEAKSDSRSLDDSDEVPISWAVPVDNLGQPGVFWAYFPTVTSSLVSGILNAPWKTNEDRQNLLEGIYNKEIVDAAASLVAGTLPKLSGAGDFGRHIDALPRRREAGDNEHSVQLRNRLYSILEDREILPDQDGILRKILEISYPPGDVTGEALARWASSEDRPRNWLHHSVLDINGPERQARLGLTARSRRQADWRWPQLRRATVSQWLEALTESADTKQEKIQASMSAVQTAAKIELSVRKNSKLGKVVLTSSENWAEADSESAFLGGGSPSTTVALVHPELQKDPATLSALRELGFRPASPGTLLAQAVSAWAAGKSDVIRDGFASLAHFEDWMDKQWDAYSEFASDIVESLGRTISGQQALSGRRILYDVLREQPTVRPDYRSWMSRYWTIFWQLAREVNQQEATTIIRESTRLWPDTLCVQTIDGKWSPVARTLLPGPIVPDDGSRDSEICIDIRYHADDLHLLAQLGAVAAPRDGQELSGLKLWRFTDECREAFQRQEGLPSTPQYTYLNFERATTSGPLDILEILSDEGKSEYTWQLLDLQDTYTPWTMRHDTRGHYYPAMEFPSPTLDALREHGRVKTADGIRRLTDGLGDTPLSPAVLQRLLSHPRSEQIRDVFGISDAERPDEQDDYHPPTDDVISARAKVAKQITDELRILKAVGERQLRERLPPGLVKILEIENGGPLNGAQVAQAAIATFHTGALREYRDAIKHLDPPSRWAGSPRAIEFVRSLGFEEEWAMEVIARREAYLEIDGPYSLPPLHDYQRKIVDKVRAMIGSNGLDPERRGMISMPTGSGKTRVAVQSIVEAIRFDGFNGGILWVADRDELCEQAVESWRQVWASEGAQGQQLRVSRMWGSQPPPIPSSDMHVIVATIQTLSAKIARQPTRYEFLSEFRLMVFDEAHRSVTRSYTTVLQELGLTRWQREDEPLLIGLTATPYRGRDKRETERLVSRYGRNRLDEGAFGSDYPEDVIGELQEMQVLARAEHDTIQGGRFQLTGSELRESESLPWLPRSVEQRIAGDAERTRRIVQACRNQVPPEWPTLIFATSVEHSKTVAALLTSVGVSARAVSAETDHSVRRRAVEQFRSGEIRVLVNYGIFGEGFDAPKTRAIVVARPVYSPNLYFQMIGRGLRGIKNGGNDRCLILNVSDNIDNFQRSLAFSELDWLWDETSSADGS